MGCCVTKDVSTRRETRLGKERSGLSLPRKLVVGSRSNSRLSSFGEMICSGQLNYKGTGHASSMEFIQPQMKELHAIWITSVLKQLRSEIDTVFLLSRLIEIMELLDPFDGNSVIRKHMCESGAVEVLSMTIKYHKRSPEIVLISIFLLTHLFFNDGISERMVPLVSLLGVLATLNSRISH